MDYVGDVTHATAAAADFFRRYQATKSAKDVEGTMAFFSTDRLTYTDAILGWVLDRASLAETFRNYMPGWGDGQSYATAVLGTESSAVLFVRDTPELFGSDLLIIGAVDIENGTITRWVDYWDGRNDASTALGMKTPPEQFPQEFGESTTPQNSSGAITQSAARLAEALADGDAAAATAMFATDATVEDMTLRTRVRGKLAISRYLHRATAALPYGSGSGLRRIHGGDLGGGYEWTNEARPVGRGITALVLDSEGLVTSLTAVWDGSLVDDDEYTALVSLAREP